MRLSANVVALLLLAQQQQALAQPRPPPPGKLYNISSFQLQLPVSDGSGGVVIISPPALATYTSEFFFTDAKNGYAMTFWCPENGAHTKGSSYPRSELRQQPNFFFDGHSELNVSMSVAQLPTGGAITVGQLHADGLTGSCSILIELEYDDDRGGKLWARLRDSACGTVSKMVGSGYNLGDTFSYTLRVDGRAVSVVTDSGSMAPYSYSWATIGGIPTGEVPMYFKAGDYVQTASSSSTNGGRVAISHINFVASSVY